MAKGHYLVMGDRTTCGGRIIEGAEDHQLLGMPVAREGDKVSCGLTPFIYVIQGGILNDTLHGRKLAGTLESFSTCPCKARFISSLPLDTYE
ncbi:hypothetical protein A9B99_21745 [Mangrovibacter phragmitis]|uniref:PAAR domain-containing protein n=1 Tax=Mangrovibacter phragmitis TaxID=1691903 RepID=A0A1B7L4N2_9ENTR|nr:PAAR domain-containing protein [Mangrovibacter phragmitis]OAT77374.1 hypothetical protein A9B99_21745 [Mangrovibacter phragmitis]